MGIMSQNKRVSDLPICQKFQEVTTSRFHYWRCSLNNHIIFWPCDCNYIHGEMINNNFEKSIAFSNILVSISRGKIWHIELYTENEYGKRFYGKSAGIWLSISDWKPFTDQTLENYLACHESVTTQMTV